ncbi:ABC-F family ATP-binding cassette domain-containing protein [Paenibacillus yanchengensis]|uniref:ABC-F family ATP-binding cassette domain-containing protein n=1 Tax=Paenibacillus yanchengensis TaxID=2035833 RepID=A0ABW4YI23_9BACL
MHLLSVEQLSKSYGEKVLFQDVTLGVAEGDKIGIIGVNGTGKSTFLKVIAGLEQADTGKRIVGKDVRIRLLEQEPVFQAGETVLEHVLGGDSPQQRAILAYMNIMERLQLDPEDEQLQTAFAQASQQMDEWDGWSIESEAKAALSKLGITTFHATIETLSGGQKKRVALAAALLLPADILILDEPTNHIDNESVAWLEAMLARRRGALLMITHDRYFLDRVSNHMIELDRGEVHYYEANYSRFLELKLERELRESASEAKRQNLLRRELEWMKRGAKARTTKQKARIDRFHTLQDNTPKAGDGKLELTVASSRLGRKIVELEQVTKSYGEKQIIQPFDFIAVPEDRVGIVGRNGAGKSTLLKIIAGKITPDSGQIELGQTVKLGVFSQEKTEMDETMRVIDYIRQDAEQIKTNDGSTISAGQMLERFLFSPTMQWTPIGKLSGGERRRLQLLRVLIAAPNVLLLDEPTNDLDITTLTILEQYLDEFAGVVFIVSHDRYFLDRTVDTIFSFEENGVIEQYEGNYTDFVGAREKRVATQQQGLRGQQQQGQSLTNNKSSTTTPKAETIASKKKLKMSYNEQRDFEQIDEWIADAEAGLTALDEQMAAASSDAMLLQQLLAEKQQQEEKLEQLMERWTELNELAEQIATQNSEAND